MNQQPPYGPNHSDSSENIAQQRVDELHHLTHEILILSTDPQLPELSQLIIRRGQLLEERRQLNINELPPDRQPPLLATLQICKDLDKAIEQNLRGFHGNLEQQIKGLKEAKTVLSKYKISDDREDTGTRSRDA
jgi:hypothetical protein